MTRRRHVYKEVDDEMIERLKAGVVLEDVTGSPTSWRQAAKVSTTGTTAW